MVDPLSLAVGGALLAAGFLSGRVGRHRSAPQPALPTCTCTHGLHAHDRETLRCAAEIQRDRYNKFGEWTGHEYVPCGCVRYVGPTPLEDVWAPPILPRSE